MQIPASDEWYEIYLQLIQSRQQLHSDVIGNIHLYERRYQMNLTPNVLDLQSDLQSCSVVILMCAGGPEP